MHISHTKSFNIPVSIALATLAHMINVYEICLNTTNYPIFNMQDFRYCLWTSIWNCFGQLVSPPCSLQTVNAFFTILCTGVLKDDHVILLVGRQLCLGHLTYWIFNITWTCDSQSRTPLLFNTLPAVSF